jgi:hypothetical protein
VLHLDISGTKWKNTIKEGGIQPWLVTVVGFCKEKTGESVRGKSRYRDSAQFFSYKIDLDYVTLETKPIFA